MVGVSAFRIVDRRESPPAYAYEVFVAPPMPRFTPFGRGCGNGYVQSYDTNDGERVAEGVVVFSTRKEARRSFNEGKTQARILERTPNFRDHEGNIGERVIVEYVSKDPQETTVSIMFYDGNDFIRYIDAPTLDLALEFEQYLISINYRSPV